VLCLRPEDVVYHCHVVSLQRQLHHSIFLYHTEGGK
jgi:hypothetical protein